jgi:hypothetical protein
MLILGQQGDTTAVICLELWLAIRPGWVVIETCRLGAFEPAIFLMTAARTPTAPSEAQLSCMEVAAEGASNMICSAVSSVERSDCDPGTTKTTICKLSMERTFLLFVFKTFDFAVRKLAF